MINGLLGSIVMAHTAPTNGNERRSRQPASERLPGLDEELEK
jgi:hypothetical protein